MLYVLQMALYCLLFVVLVKCAAGNSGLNCLYFYPKAYIDEAQKRGIADKDAVMKKGTRFMVPFCIVMLAALVAILSLWNRVTDFWTAYVQSYLFLVVMNWFDGLVIDMLWVGHSKFWAIPKMEDVPYTQTWGQMLKKRLTLTVIWLVGAFIIAGLVMLMPH